MCLLLTMAFKCSESNVSQQEPVNTPKRQTSTGTRLKGNYTYTDGYRVFKRFVFDSDGTFARGAAATATTGHGRDNVGVAEDTGTYIISNGTLTLQKNDGTTEEHRLGTITELSPMFISIDGERYTRRD